MSNAYFNILITFDGSDGSLNALQEAEKIGQLSKACLTIIYAQDHKPMNEVRDVPLYGVTTAPVTSMMNQSNAHVGKLPVESNLIDFDQVADKIITIAKAKLSGSIIDVEIEVLMGTPAKELCTFAEHHEVDLIVIGQRGRSGIKKLVMGCVSNKVTNSASCPVLVVK
ncbi:universal stress protein [Radiobacillus sp. PE A8.2]|uniref:universal stress protein n=1 Tax=Radiobacillus sp. PE A8.2 TaxID=3380349 RepID=UPI003890FE96